MPLSFATTRRVSSSSMKLLASSSMVRSKVKSVRKEACWLTASMLWGTQSSLCWARTETHGMANARAKRAWVSLRDNMGCSLLKRLGGQEVVIKSKLFSPEPVGKVHRSTESFDKLDFSISFPSSYDRASLLFRFFLSQFLFACDRYTRARPHGRAVGLAGGAGAYGFLSNQRRAAE